MPNSYYNKSTPQPGAPASSSASSSTNTRGAVPQMNIYGANGGKTGAAAAGTSTGQNAGGMGTGIGGAAAVANPTFQQQEGGLFLNAHVSNVDQNLGDMNQGEFVTKRVQQ